MLQLLAEEATPNPVLPIWQEMVLGLIAFGFVWAKGS